MIYQADEELFFHQREWVERIPGNLLLVQFLILLLTAGLGVPGVRKNQLSKNFYLGSNGNFLFGKEFMLGQRKDKSRILSINTKVALLGARRYTPIDLEASIAKGYTVRKEELAFSERGEDVLIANLAIAYRVDRKNTSQELKIDIQNVTNNQAQIDEYYNSYTEEIPRKRGIPVL